MKSWQFSRIQSVCVAALCLLLPAVGFSLEMPEEGLAEFYKAPDKPAAPWAEDAAKLPAYPEAINRLIALNVSTEGLRYQIYLDPASLTSGDDRVVRFTTVLISSSGVWNVNYEGLHCGEHQSRRFAYGSNGKWHLLKDSPWRPVTGLGMYQYRKFLYEEYLCDAATEYLAVDEMVRKLRSRNTIDDD